MEVITLIIAIVALVIAVAAFRRTGGIRDLRHQVESLSPKSEGVRNRTADVLDRLERLVRGKEKSGSQPDKDRQAGE